MDDVELAHAKFAPELRHPRRVKHQVGNSTVGRDAVGAAHWHKPVGHRTLLRNSAAVQDFGARPDWVKWSEYAHIMATLDQGPGKTLNMVDDPSWIRPGIRRKDGDAHPVRVPGEQTAE